MNTTRLDDKLNVLLIAAFVAILGAINIDVAHDKIVVAKQAQAQQLAQQAAAKTVVVAAR